jgi:hypothetical protein
MVPLRRLVPQHFGNDEQVHCTATHSSSGFTLRRYPGDVAVPFPAEQGTQCPAFVDIRLEQQDFFIVAVT